MHGDQALACKVMAESGLNVQYAKDGYAMQRGFVSGDALRTLQNHVDRFIQEVVPTMPPEHVFFEDKSDRSTLKQLQQMGLHDTWFDNLFTKGPFRSLAEQLLGARVIPKNMQFFNKPPGVGQATPPHQGGFYFKLDPCEALTMWFALEDVDEENGCVRYVRGSHQLGMREHGRTQTLGFSQGIIDFPQGGDTANEVAFPAQAGDLLVHDALTIHRAEGNRSSTRSRRALGFIYYSEHAREDLGAHRAYQQRLAKELKASGKI